jgi:putative membrane-bound dehydrogenase-like protein
MTSGRTQSHVPGAHRGRGLHQSIWFAGVALAAVSVALSGSWAVPLAGWQGGRTAPQEGRPIHVLFLGMDEERPHNPARMFPHLASPLARRGIQLTYMADQAQALDAATLKYYDVLMIYGNQTAITPSQEGALLSFVEGGKGLVALHAASAMFTNSDKYIALVGAQFQRHAPATEFKVEVVQPNHPVMQGVQSFTSFDEPYEHVKHNPQGRTVLMERPDPSGAREPWTWVRTEGQGRVFYTASGHDERTWDRLEFQKMVENAVLWTVDTPTRQAYQRFEVPGITYVDGYTVPNYERRTPDPKYQMPFEPELAQKFMQTPAAFDIQLFASEPMIVKPICMTFDERGRLWTIESRDYPNVVLNGQPGDDMIKILEDTNGDGRADKVTVFADKINLATSLTFANGGVIVAAMPNMLFFKDTNGDDKADTREILSTGWGMRDTHGEASNLQYGPDNYVWGSVGYNGGNVNGKQFSQGAYRFKPDGSGFEVMTQSTNNTWGLGFNESFDVFGSTANGDPSWFMGIPARFFEGVAGIPGAAGGGGRGGIAPAALGYQSLANFTVLHPTTPYIRQVDNQGFYTAGAGHMFYTARAFPKEYWNRIAFINEPTAHIVGQGIVESKGAGYATSDGWNLVSSAEEWFAPIASMVGPDGAVWVDDWYNFIAQHNPTPTDWGYANGRGGAYETSMRDHIRGRIYRVVYKGAPPQKKRSLSKNDTAGLLEALASDNMFWRLTAQRLLVERNQKDVVPQLLALVRNTSVDAIGLNGGAMHALWTLQGLGELNSTSTESYRAAAGALKHPSAAVRKAAAMVLPKQAEAATAVLDAGLLHDPDLHTRLAAALVVAEMPGPQIGQALYKESQKPDTYGDPWLGRAFYVAAMKHQDGFLSSYKADASAMPFSSLSVPLRMGSATPDWRMPSAAEIAADWKDMQLPGNWESRGLPDFDGIVWFMRTVNLPAGTLPDTLSLGPVRNSGRVWINGVAVGPQGPGRGAGAAAPVVTPAAPAAGQTAAVAAPAGAPTAAGAARGRGQGGGAGPAGAQAPAAPAGPVAANITATARAADLAFPVPAGVFHPGANTITVQVTNQRAEGGFVGTAQEMFLATGQAHTDLSGAWKYRVERSSNNGTLYSKAGELAAHVAFTAGGGLTGAAGASLPVAAAVPDVILQLSVVANEMKYATPELTVAPGQLIEIVYTNPDQNEHNFVLVAPGTLEQVGAAADALSQTPAAKSMDYVPDVAQVLFKTKMLAAGQSVRFQFTAPAAPGQYPFLCTYPNHWRLMNGMLNVVAPAGRGGGRGGAPTPTPAPAPGIGRGGILR